MAKTHVGILEVDRESSLPNLRAGKGGYGFEGTTPKYWDGSSWSAFSGASGGISTWDALYDLDKTMVIDDTTVSFSGTHATNDVFTLLNATGTGEVLQISNSGTGKDINGTAGTWSVTKAGAVVATALAMADNELITFGTGSDATIGWDGSLLNIAGVVDFDDNVTLAASATVTQAGLAGSTVFTVTAGDVVMSDGSLALTDADNAASLSVTNATATTANVVAITADAATTGSILYIDNGGASLTSGNYIDCNDDGTSDFTVAADGATTITTADVATAGLTVTGIQTAEELVTFDNASGVIASDHAVLLLDAGGAVASGGNILRVAPTGTPNAGAIAVELVGASKTCQMLYADGDATAASVVAFNGGGAIATTKAVLEVTADGTPADAASSVARFTFGGTATNNPQVLYVGNGTADAAPLVVNSNVASATRAAATIIQDSTTGAQSVATLQQDDVSEEFIAFNSTAASGAAVDLTNTTPAGVAGSIIVSAVNGTKYRIPLYAAAGWS